MLGQHPVRRFAAIGLLGTALFIGFVVYLWQDEERREWNWEHNDSTIVGHALGRAITNGKQSSDFSVDLYMHRDVAYARLLPLLANPAPEVREAAARLLSSTRIGKPEDLPTLIAAHQRGLAVLSVIAATGTPEAEAYVFTERSKSTSPQDVAWNLVTSGPQNLERLTSVYRGPDPINPEVHRALCAILHDKPHATIATAFVSVARDTAVLPHNRTAALEVLSLMGDTSTETVPTLRELASHESDPVAKAADAAATRIEGKGTLARHLPDLGFELGMEYSSVWRSLEVTLRELAALGPSGRVAGPLVMRLLDSPEWELRVESARLLGIIGYAEAAPQLLIALENKDDWVLTGAAAEALARLGAIEATPALQRVAANHWYPPIRALATESIQVLAGQAEFPKPERPLTYFGWSRDMALDRHVREFDERPPTSAVITRIARRLTCLVPNTWDRLWRWRADRIAKASDFKSSRPDYGQAFGDGYLLGYDDGEWGGRIASIVGGETVREFRVGNVKGFYPMPFGLVAVTSHIQSGEGMLYLIKTDTGGAITCEPFQRLPFETESGFHFAPVARRWNSELLILGDRRAVVLTRSGELRMVD